MKTISNITGEYLTWLQVERRFAQSSIVSHRSRLKSLLKEENLLPELCKVDSERAMNLVEKYMSFIFSNCPISIYRKEYVGLISSKIIK